VLVLVAVIAYPYIPGSSSDAFKAISLFIGVLLSLGSSSFLSNLIAGYSLTYRRAFRMGDRVKIGEIVGDIIAVRLQVTHVRTLKNEEVIIPNSQILNSEVTNYSSMAHQPGVILHTTIGIGYETPWRQVEAMLLIAAQRTPGTLKVPAPFVLQKSLGDFAIVYELNVYSNDEHSMPRQYTALHHQILDIFNEYGVQIMTPAYERDPDAPKVVPKQQWFSPPATGFSTDGGASSTPTDLHTSPDQHTPS
jgi:small-conductance mechanosensitive channel